MDRVIAYGPSLDLLFLDMRSYRGPNTANDQAAPGPDTAFLGASQVARLKRRLAASRATWKVICADMPLGLVVADGATGFEAVAQGDGPPLGRELEIADLLAFIAREGIRNTVWITADVHYTAAHHYDPARARYKDFAPFWEFVSGPLHAGSFPAPRLDDTFGPEVRYAKAPALPNRPPSEGLQFFGHVAIDGATEAMRVRLMDVAGATLFEVRLEPEA